MLFSSSSLFFFFFFFFIDGKRFVKNAETRALRDWT
jgi:hypothetical protein